MTRPQQIILETLEKEIRETFSYNQPLKSNDLSEDARIARAFFLTIAIVHVPQQMIIQYLHYGTDESFLNTFNWVKNEVDNQPEWKKVLDYINQKVKAKCNL